MHVPSLPDLAGGLELEWLDGGSDIELTIGNDDVSTTIKVLGGDVLVGIGSIFRVDLDVVWATSGGRMDWNDGFKVRVGGVVPRRRRVGLGGHDRRRVYQ